MNKSLVVLGISAWLGIVAPANADPQKLSMGWVLDGGRSVCSLYRTHNGQFVFMAINGDGSALLRVHDKAWLSRSGQPGQFELAKESEDRLIPGHSATTSNGWGGIVATMERQMIGTLATADRLAVRIDDAEVGTVDLNGLSQPMISLQNCADKLPPVASHVVKAPELISNLDAIDFHTGDQNLRPLVFRLSVDEQGKVGGCEIVQSSGSSAIDETACSSMQRQAQFRPAIDSDGNAVASTYQRRIVFLK